MQQIHVMEEIDSFISEHTAVFLYISQPDCSVCHALLPKVEHMLTRYPNIKSAHIDATEIPQVAEKFMVFTVPVLLFFLEGKEVLRRARIVSMDELEYEVEKIYHLFFE